MDKLKKMAVFARVVELGSFAAAAKDQEISAAIVGRHVADLEGLLGVRLINRTTRSMEVTEAGLRYYRGCQSILEETAALELDAAEQDGADLSGTIRLAAPEGIGSPLLLDAIQGFQSRHPRVLFDLVFDNNPTDFVSTGVDLAIRLAISLEDSSLIISKLADTHLGLFAAPSYLEAKGTPRTVAELNDHACLVFGTSRFGNTWPLPTKNGLRKLRLSWKLVINETHVYRDAMARGLGIGLLPEVMASDLVSSGHLVPVTLEARFPEVGVYVVYPNKAFQPRRIRMFQDYLRNQLRGQSI